MKRVLLMAALAVLLVPGAALADTIISFAGAGHYTGVTSMTLGPITAHGWGPPAAGSSNAFYDPAVLYQRNDPSDMGLGVCSEGQSVCDFWGGNYNELDDLGAQELISLSKDPGFVWVAVTLSSLDMNGFTDPPERGELYACDSADPNLVTSCALISQFSASGNGSIVTLTIPIPVAYQNASGIFFVPTDWLNHTNANNDFLVSSVTIRTPEPATFGLLGLGLGSLALALKRRKK